MRPARSASCASNPLPALPRLLLGCLLALACVLAQAADLSALPGPGAEGVIDIRTAEVLVSDAGTMPPADAAWETVPLPHRARKPGRFELVAYWYKSGFVLQHAGAPQWLLLPKLRSGGRIFLNGHYIGEVRSADTQTHVRWFRPHMVLLPPGLLQAGANELAFQFSIREPVTSFGDFQVGPEVPMRRAFDRWTMIEHTSVGISMAVCVLSGLFILAFWLRRPDEGIYGLFGASVVFWGIRTLVYRLPEVPMEFWVLWRVSYYFSTVGFIVCISLFLLRFSRSERPLLARLLVANWLGGCLLFLALGTELRTFMDTWWTLSFLPAMVYAFWRVLRMAIVERAPAAIAIAAAIFLAIALALHDFMAQHGMFGLQDFYLLHIGVPILLLVMGFIQLDRFVRLLKHAEKVNDHLARRVAQRERELLASHEALRLLEREHAITEERKRIMQDMHDGVGSQLLSTLVMVRRGAATQESVATLLQECLDDMRLVIDSLSPVEPDLLPVLGNLRFRMETRFKAIGIDFTWRNHDLPDQLELAPHAGLQVLRILQEALTNVLKHAGATKVDVDLHFSAGSLTIEVTDNGSGFDPAARSGGRGMGNMRMRAERLGGALSVRTGPQGSCCMLSIPITPLAIPGA